MRQAAVDLVKPATHHQKKAKHAEAKITDVKAKAIEAHEGATQKRKLSSRVDNMFNFLGSSTIPIKVNREWP